MVDTTHCPLDSINPLVLLTHEMTPESLYKALFKLELGMQSSAFLWCTTQMAIELQTRVVNWYRYSGLQWKGGVHRNGQIHLETQSQSQRYTDKIHVHKLLFNWCKEIIIFLVGHHTGLTELAWFPNPPFSGGSLKKHGWFSAMMVQKLHVWLKTAQYKCLVGSEGGTEGAGGGY